MNTRTKLSIVAVLLIILLGLGFASIPQTTTPQTQDTVTFALSSWAYPDEYGQYIEGIIVYENSTGSWVQVAYYTADDTYIFEWNQSVFIKLECVNWLNSTLVGAIDGNDGKNYQRHNVTVTSLGETVFSQQNFTYVYKDIGIDPPLWLYQYDVVLNFLPQAGEIYTVTITYEVYY